MIWVQDIYLIFLYHDLGARNPFNISFIMIWVQEIYLIFLYYDLGAGNLFNISLL